MPCVLGAPTNPWRFPGGWGKAVAAPTKEKATIISAARYWGSLHHAQFAGAVASTVPTTLTPDQHAFQQLGQNQHWKAHPKNVQG